MNQKYIVVSGTRVLLAGSESLSFPSEAPCPVPDESEIFHPAPGIVAFEADFSAPDGLEWHELRSAWLRLAAEDYRVAAKSRELLYWNSQWRRCPACGAALKRHSEISKLCGDCGAEYFPPMQPAVLVLVTRGDEALLVHARNFSRPFFGLVAGFVETGESLEECVRREVREETSLEITDIRYFGSQSWPFPANIMIGFTARYESGDLRFADGELSQGGFFRRDALPVLATPPSLAREMIDRWAEGAID